MLRISRKDKNGVLVPFMHAFLLVLHEEKDKAMFYKSTFTFYSESLNVDNNSADFAALRGFIIAFL